MRRWQLLVPVLTLVLVALLTLAYLVLRSDGPAAITSSPATSPRAASPAVVSPPTQPPTAAPTPTHSRAPAPSPTTVPPSNPAASPNPAALPPPLVFADGLVSTKPRPSDYWFRRAVGSLTASFVGWPRDPRIEIRDAATGTRTVVPKSGDGFPAILKFDGASITWLASWIPSSASGNSRPGGKGHSNHWAIRRYDLIDHSVTTVDNGVNHWLTDDTTVHTPLVAVDGDLMVYDSEIAGPGHRVRLVVRNIRDGTVARVIKVDRPVFELSLSGGDVSYLEGDIAEWVFNSPDNERRVVAHPDGSREQIPVDNWSWVVEGDTRVWEDIDPWDGPIRDYAVFATQAGETSQIGIRNENAQFVHGEGFVAWKARFSDVDALLIYDTVTHRTATIETFSEMNLGLVGGMLEFRDRTFVWDSEEGDTLQPFINSVPIAQIRAAFDALADGQ